MAFGVLVLPLLPLLLLLLPELLLLELSPEDPPPLSIFPTYIPSLFGVEPADAKTRPALAGFSSEL